MASNIVSKLLDFLGRPVDRAVLSEQQSDAPEIAVMHRSWELHPSAGLTPAAAALILQQAESGWLMQQADLYSDMEEDDHIFTEMSKRRRALLTVPWTIQEPPGADKQETSATAFLTEAVSELPMSRILFEMGDAIGKGFSAQEMEWALEDKVWLPKGIAARPQRWFRLDFETRMELRLRDGSASGAELRPFGWILHRHPAKSGYTARQALFRVLVWPWLYRRFGARDLAEFLEVYGLPVKIGTFPTGADDKQKALLFRALMSIGHNAAGIIPEGMAIEFKDAARGAGGNDPFLSMIGWTERSISKAILGGTLNSDASGGTKTNALGEVHQQAALDLRDADAVLFAETIREQLFRALLSLNGYAPRRLPLMAFDLAPEEDTKAWANTAVLFIDRGLPVAHDTAYEKLKIAKPKDGEPVLTVKAQETIRDSTTGTPADAPADVQTASGLSSPSPLAGEGRGEGASPAAYADLAANTLASEAAPAWQKLLDGVRALVMEAKSLPELRDKLLAAYGELDSEDLAKVMALGFAAADLAGQCDVKAGE